MTMEASGCDRLNQFKAGWAKWRSRSQSSESAWAKKTQSQETIAMGKMAGYESLY
jgi:hypothetical protein